MNISWRVKGETEAGFVRWATRDARYWEGGRSRVGRGGRGCNVDKYLYVGSNDESVGAGEIDEENALHARR